MTKKEQRWEVQTYTFCDGWVNCWRDEEGEPLTFATKEEAQAELDEFLQDIQDQIDSGEREPEDGYSRDNFEVMPVGTTNDDDSFTRHILGVN